MDTSQGFHQYLRNPLWVPTTAQIDEVVGGPDERNWITGREVAGFIPAKPLQTIQALEVELVFGRQVLIADRLQPNTTVVDHHLHKPVTRAAQDQELVNFENTDDRTKGDRERGPVTSPTTITDPIRTRLTRPVR